MSEARYVKERTPEHAKVCDELFQRIANGDARPVSHGNVCMTYFEKIGDNFFSINIYPDGISINDCGGENG